MISSARLLGLGTACAALLIAGAGLSPAGAQADTCKADVVTASGKAKFRPFSKTKELEGRGSAMADAVASWQKEVGARFGQQWKMWSRAKDTTFDCAPTKTGKIIGSSFIGCTIKGRPCSFVARPGGGTAADDAGRARDKGRRGGDGEGPRHRDTVYDRAMAYQDHLTDERRKAEARAYEREMVYQTHLAAEREREAARAYQREMARQRHLADERRRFD
jgi:hypothetical protein